LPALPDPPRLAPVSSGKNLPPGSKKPVAPKKTEIDHKQEETKTPRFGYVSRSKFFSNLTLIFTGFC